MVNILLLKGLMIILILPIVNWAYLLILKKNTCCLVQTDLTALVNMIFT